MSLTNSFTGTGPLVQAGQLKSSRQDQICKPRLVFIALLLLPLLYKLARAASSGVERSALPHPLHQHQETGCAWGARVRTGGPSWPAPVRMIAAVYAAVASLRTNESNFEPAGRRFNSCRAHQWNRRLMRSRHVSQLRRLRGGCRFEQGCDVHFLNNSVRLFCARD